MYTTREIEAESGDEANVVAAFNPEVETATIPVETGGIETVEEALKRELELQHLPVSGVNFSSTPADAPELREQLAFFEHELEKNASTLFNAWGAIIVTQNQSNLKRIDVVITWDEVEIVDGQPVMNPDGTPKLVLNDDGTPNRRIVSTHVFIHEDAAYFAH
jgi:hypothetical protein